MCPRRGFGVPTHIILVQGSIREERICLVQPKKQNVFVRGLSYVVRLVGANSAGENTRHRRVSSLALGFLSSSGGNILTSNLLRRINPPWLLPMAKVRLRGDFVEFDGEGCSSNCGDTRRHDRANTTTILVGRLLFCTQNGSMVEHHTARCVLTTGASKPETFSMVPSRPIVAYMP